MTVNDEISSEESEKAVELVAVRESAGQNAIGNYETIFRPNYRR